MSEFGDIEIKLMLKPMTLGVRKAKAEKAIRAAIYSELCALARDTGCIPYGIMVDSVRVEGLNSQVAEFDYRVHIRIAGNEELNPSGQRNLTDPL